MIGRRVGRAGGSVAVLLFAVSAAAVQAQDTPDYFRQKCASCHTIGGSSPMAGPDLKGLSERQPDRDWLIRFMMDPKAMIESGDDYATKLFRQANNAVMPTLIDLDRARAEKLLDLIEAESKLEKSNFQGLKLLNRPFTPEDVVLGRAIFEGRVRLDEKGASCISCHTMHDAPALGGGRLGPDLTNVYERVKGLSAWLTTPSTETMQPIFKDHPMTPEEVHALAAYFESAVGQTPAQPGGSRVALLLMGLIGTAVLVFGFDAIWKRRFQGVRQPLVDGQLRGNA